MLPKGKYPAAVLWGTTRWGCTRVWHVVSGLNGLLCWTHTAVLQADKTTFYSGQTKKTTALLFFPCCVGFRAWKTHLQLRWHRSCGTRDPNKHKTFLFPIPHPHSSSWSYEGQVSTDFCGDVYRQNKNIHSIKRTCQHAVESKRTATLVCYYDFVWLCLRNKTVNVYWCLWLWWSNRGNEMQGRVQGPLVDERKNAMMESGETGKGLETRDRWTDCNTESFQF